MDKLENRTWHSCLHVTLLVFQGKPCRQFPPPKRPTSTAPCALTLPSCSATPTEKPNSGRVRSHWTALTSCPRWRTPFSSAQRTPLLRGNGSGLTFPAAANGAWEPQKPIPLIHKFQGQAGVQVLPDQRTLKCVSDWDLLCVENSYYSENKFLQIPRECVFKTNPCLHSLCNSIESRKNKFDARLVIFCVSQTQCLLIVVAETCISHLLLPEPLLRSSFRTSCTGSVTPRWCASTRSPKRMDSNVKYVSYRALASRHVHGSDRRLRLLIVTHWHLVNTGAVDEMCLFHCD